MQYLSGFFLTIGTIGLVLYYANYYVPPNCFDRVLNGAESGVDCGGECVQICRAEVIAPRVVWTESFLIQDGQYNVVAYVENQNQTVGTPNLGYTFQLLSNGEVIGERSGVTALPPNSIYPVFEGRVLTDVNREVTETRIVIDSPEFWLPSSVGRDQFRTLDINLTNADSSPRLSVQLENTTLERASNVEVVATIFNDAGEPVTASQTFEENIEARTTRNIVFTWPNPIAKTVRNCVIPTDVALAIDLSGSMNNDGDMPPQPITSTLEAASRFIGNLRANDKVSVVTFASEARLEQGLTNEQIQVSSRVIDLTIDPEEETGFTNTSAALELANAELSSVRHNQSARRVLVLLTDGLPTAKDNDDFILETEAKAREIKENGVEIYAIGLGQNVDRAFIEAVASGNGNAYLAPTVTDLNRIYSEITSSLCEVGPTKIDVVAKTKTNFAPLR
jgi:Mg-chelatase subunit ChlD